MSDASKPLDGAVRCRLCGRSVQEIGGFLVRVNPKGVPGIWECRPNCNARMTFESALLAAIDSSDTATQRPPNPKGL